MNEAGREIRQKMAGNVVGSSVPRGCMHRNNTQQIERKLEASKNNCIIYNIRVSHVALFIKAGLSFILSLH